MCIIISIALQDSTAAGSQTDGCSQVTTSDMLGELAVLRPVISKEMVRVPRMKPNINCRL